jgi:hypothetical protein
MPDALLAAGALARNNEACAPPYGARKDSFEFSTAGAEDTKCSPSSHPTSGELAAIEALIAHADRLLSTCRECGFHQLTATIEHGGRNARKWLAMI